VFAGDWPQWRGPFGTGHLPASNAGPSKLPAEPKTLWRMKVGEGLASPVVADGKLIYFDAENGKETIRVMNLADQKQLWAEAVDETFKDSQGPAGPRSTPLVNDGRVYAQSCRGELQCRNLADGKLLWRANFLKDFGAEFVGEKGNVPGAVRHGYNASPVIYGARLYATVGSTNNASVVAFDKTTGKVIWKGGSDMAGYAPLVRGKLSGRDQIVAFTAESVMGLDDRDGTVLWRHPVKTAYGRHVTTPIIFEEELVIVSSHQVGMMAIRVKNQDGKIQAEQAWLSKDSAMNFSSPVLVGQHVYGLGPRKDLVCVEAATGKLAWSQTGYFATSADKAHGGFIAMKDRILALTDNGELVMFAANPAEFKDLGRAQVCGMNWCNPAYSNGRLYIREGIKTTGELLAVQLSE